jgi:hypothetical protein
MASGVLMLGQTQPTMAIPYDYGTGGHYRVNHQCAIVNTQGANTRLFVLRNPSTTFNVIITRLTLQLLQTGAHTAAIEDSIDAYKLTTFTTLDTTNTVTPAAAVMHTSQMVAVANSLAQVRGVTVAGNAAGMTGGTSTKSGLLTQLPIWFLAAAAANPAVMAEIGDRVGEHPLLLESNEGLLIENRVLLGAAAAASVYIDCSWAEVPIGVSF